MKFKFINELKNKNVLEQNFSLIPKEKFEEFFCDAICPMLDTNTNISHVSIELARAVTNNATVTFYFFGKNLAGYIRFDISKVVWCNNVKNYNEDTITERWTEFLKHNLGDDLYKKFVAIKMKKEIEETNYHIYLMERGVKHKAEELKKDEVTLQKWQTEQEKRVEKFNTDFADVLDENGDIIGL